MLGGDGREVRGPGEHRGTPNAAGMAQGRLVKQALPCGTGDSTALCGDLSGRGSKEGEIHAYVRPLPVAQLVTDPPTMQQTPVQSLAREDLLEEGLATHSSVLRLPCWLRG